jgi:hypothetical protein
MQQHNPKLIVTDGKEAGPVLASSREYPQDIMGVSRRSLQPTSAIIDREELPNASVVAPCNVVAPCGHSLDANRGILCIPPTKHRA